ncbi:response regulator [Spirosoma validum]|uniref:Response regulator n=1 Tax=Spirosoma validum TaxID=2771355 RepID=A0A927B8I7_9BACT|nr:response regulator [Spirosoma validum]MBD2757685.1 response regulator [Spirosoma validum]
MTTTTTTNPQFSTTRILVVDDNADATLILGMSLQLKGYDVQTCLNGQQALERTQSWRPQAILLDISMPGMDGFETIRRLREHPWGQEVVIIALTGYGQAEDQQRTRAAGFDEHWIKPVDLTLMPTRLLELITKKQAGAATE